MHLSIKMTTPHQSGAPFVGERVFQNQGVCGQALPSFPSPTPLLPPFCSRPIFRAARMQKNSFRVARISFASYGNACYAGYVVPVEWVFGALNLPGFENLPLVPVIISSENSGLIPCVGFHVQIFVLASIYAN